MDNAGHKKMGRSIVTISLPRSMAERVRARVRSGEFASVSDYFRYAVREEQRIARLLSSRKQMVDEYRIETVDLTRNSK